jgi:hypothetical protein
VWAVECWLLTIGCRCRWHGSWTSVTGVDCRVSVIVNLFHLRPQNCWKITGVDCQVSVIVNFFRLRPQNCWKISLGIQPTRNFTVFIESPTPRITDTRSRRLPASPIRRVGHWIFLKKPLRIDDTESRRLPVSLSRRVADSAYRWVGESTTLRIGDTGSRCSKKKLIWCRFSELLTAKACL